MDIYIISMEIEKRGKGDREKRECRIKKKKKRKEGSLPFA